jgi:RNA polymerase sigma factor (sigma-70 family)
VLDAYQGVVCQLTARGPKKIGRNRGAYFYRSAINAAIEQIRRRQRDRQRLGELAERQAQRPTSDGPGTSMEHVRLLEQIRAAVLALPSHLRDVVVLRDLAGFDYSRVSQTLKITPGTARVYRRQAIVRLSEMMA